MSARFLKYYYTSKKKKNSHECVMGNSKHSISRNRYNLVDEPGVEKSNSVFQSRDNCWTYDNRKDYSKARFRGRKRQTRSDPLQEEHLKVNCRSTMKRYHEQKVDGGSLSRCSNKICTGKDENEVVWLIHRERLFEFTVKDAQGAHIHDVYN